MKKLVIVLLVMVIASVSIYSEGLSLKLGMIVNQSVNDLDDYYEEVDLNSNLNLETVYDFKLEEYLDLGIGVEVGLSELKIEGEKLGIRMHPVYGQVKWNFSRKKRINPYIFFKLGKNIVKSKNENLENGNYVGLGGGIEIGNFLMQLAIDSGMIEESEEEEKYKISRLIFSFGLNFRKDYKNRYNN